FWCFHLHFIFLFFFNDPSTTQIYTLSLHDALPICLSRSQPDRPVVLGSKGINLRLKARALNLPAEDYDAVKIKDLSHLPRGKDELEVADPGAIDRLYQEESLPFEAILPERPPSNHYYILRGGSK